MWEQADGGGPGGYIGWYVGGGGGTRFGPVETNRQF